MREFKMSFDDLVILRMTTEALKAAIRRKGRGDLDKLHFIEFNCEIGDEVLSSVPQYEISARGFTKSPIVSEKINKVIVKGTASIFYQSFMVEAECMLYRHELEGAGRSILEPGHITIKYMPMRDSDENWEEHLFRYHNHYDVTRSYGSILKDDLSKKDKLKLAIISTEVLPDYYVENLVLDWEIKDTNDLDEILGCLEKHRPEIAKRFHQGLQKK